MTAERHDVEAVYRRERPRLVRVAYLLTGSTVIAEDLVQEAFVATWHRLATVDQPAAYVRQTVVNLARKHYRRADLERRHAPQPPGTQLPPEIDDTWAALWELSDRERTALVLRFYEDLEVADVAAAMSCRLGTAKSLIHRGVASLRRLLEEQR